MRATWVTTTQLVLVASFLCSCAEATLDSRQAGNTNLCPSADSIVYSPFSPYFRFYPSNPQKCWSAIICLYERADEARKLQFGATALVMGFVPLFLKDIAWPERRALAVTRPPAAALEVLIRAMGLTPTVTGSAQVTRAMTATSSALGAWAIAQSRATVAVLADAAAAVLLVGYAAVALVEIYSKRCVLGCVYPVFVLTWLLLAFAPASLHTLLGRLRHRHNSRRGSSIAGLLVASPGTPGTQSQGLVGGGNKRQSGAEATAVQGADEAWFVQLTWAVYYIAGTLVFTSIAAVTVIELFAWVVIGFTVTGASKLLAFFLALYVEKE